MNQFAKSLLAIGVIATTLSGTAAYAATLERDIFADTYTVSRESHKTGSFGIKMTDADGKTVHLSFAQDASYCFQLAPDVTSSSRYTLTVGSQGETEAEEIQNISVYATSAKLAVLAELNAAETETDVKTVLKNRADVLELNRHPIYNAEETPLATVSDADLNIIAKAVYAEGADYADLQTFYKAYYASKGLILLNNAKDAQTAASIGHVYESYLRFDELEGYGLLSGFVKDVYPYYIGQNQTTREKAAAAFGGYAFLCAVSHAENEQQVLDLFENYGSLVTFDLTVWNESAVASAALVIPIRICLPSAGCLPSFFSFSFISS